MQGLLGLGQRGTSIRATLLDRGEGEQDAALRVDVEVGVGRGRQLPCRRDAAFPCRLVPLADGDGADDEGDEECERDRRE